MKRLIRTLFLAGVLMAALCATAWAAENTPTEAGILNVALISGSNVTITPAGADGNITADNGFYAKADRVNVTVPATSGMQYLVLALNDNSATPTEKNIVYIDQDGAAGDTVSFTVYPSQLVSGTTYHIYTSSTNAELLEVGSFEYYAPYKLGDVDENGDIDVRDAIAILGHMAKNRLLAGNPLKAADVTNDGSVDVQDAIQVLRYIAKNIVEF